MKTTSRYATAGDENEYEPGSNGTVLKNLCGITTIADLLHRITFIEKAGTGIKRMRDEAHDQSCPEPLFEEDGFFTAIFCPNPEVQVQLDNRQEAGAVQTVEDKRYPL